jgi:alkylated DNA repair dioxygenase AlkB
MNDAPTATMENQLALFEAGQKKLPEGFRYQADVISAGDEITLLERIRELPFKPFEFHGYLGKRRVVSFGWKYDFEGRKLEKSRDIPDFLLELREVMGRFANISSEDLQMVLVSEYEAGAGIGWHRDKDVFGQVVGLSLVSRCVFRLRRKVAGKWERASVVAEPRSAYLMSGPSRTEWEHSIPEVNALRYSVTFRNFREDVGGSGPASP